MACMSQYENQFERWNTYFKCSIVETTRTYKVTSHTTWTLNITRTIIVHRSEEFIFRVKVIKGWF